MAASAVADSSGAAARSNAAAAANNASSSIINRDDMIVAALQSLGASEWHTNSDIRVAAQQLFPDAFLSADKRFPRDALRYLHAVESRRRPGRKPGARGLTEYRLHNALIVQSTQSQTDNAKVKMRQRRSLDSKYKRPASDNAGDQTSDNSNNLDDEDSDGSDESNADSSGASNSFKSEESRGSKRVPTVDPRRSMVPPRKRRKPMRNESAQSPPPRDKAQLLWAKVADFPWWPCKVVRTISDIPDSSTRRALQGQQPPGDPDAKCVNFLVDDTYLWVDSAHLKPWDGPDQRKLLAQRGDGVEGAVEAALSLLGSSASPQHTNKTCKQSKQHHQSSEGRRIEKQAIEQALRTLGADGWHTCGQIRTEAQRLFPQLRDIDSQRFPSGYLRAMQVERRRGEASQYEYRLLGSTVTRTRKRGPEKHTEKARGPRRKTTTTSLARIRGVLRNVSSSSVSGSSSDDDTSLSSSDDGYSAASELLAASAAARRGLTPLRVASSSVIEGMNARAAEAVDVAAAATPLSVGESESPALARASAAAALATWSSIAPSRSPLFRAHEDALSQSQVSSLPAPQREIVLALLQLGKWSSSAEVCAEVERSHPDSADEKIIRSALNDSTNAPWLCAPPVPNGKLEPRRPPARSQSWQDPPIPREFGTPSHGRAEVLLAAAFAESSSDDEVNVSEGLPLLSSNESSTLAIAGKEE